MIVGIDKGAAPVGIAEAKAWLRLGGSQDDAVVAGLIRSAVDLCEAFTGQMLIVRTVTEEMPLGAGWIGLVRRPVVAVEAVTGLAGDEETGLDAEAWRVEIDRDGAARLRVDDPGAATQLRIAYRAGMAAEANAVPEAIRQGLARMIQHLHGARDDAPEVPAIIAALWQPWRRVGLGAGARR
ncbi:MAG: head-tail connector protein [Sphingopyxis sp.]|uniref:head-tail connector protein n=1 Tax=Sphingopyxis sp. TaxID=1908224 RepID=UPI003D6D6185